MRGVFVTILAAAVSLGGCSSISEIGENFSDSSANQIRVGKTSKAAIEKNLGSPRNQETTANGEEVWTYEFNRSTSVFNPAGVLLSTSILGETSSRSEYKLLTVSFRQNIVSKCKLSIYARDDLEFNSFDRQILKEANCGKTPVPLNMR